MEESCNDFVCWIVLQNSKVIATNDLVILAVLFEKLSDSFSSLQLRTLEKIVNTILGKARKLILI